MCHSVWVTEHLLWENVIAFVVTPVVILILVHVRCCFVSGKADETPLV